MPGVMDNPAIEHLVRMADELGIKIEMAGGIPTWETHPAIRHQHALKQIMSTIKIGRMSASDCGCVWYPDVEVKFPDGSINRPDISIGCRMPDELEEKVTLIPEAVIEVISKGFEKKDTEIGAPFYLSMGIKDVVIVNPYTDRVEHRTADGTRELKSPTRIELVCGCECTA
jgi:hypothetical protein